MGEKIHPPTMLPRGTPAKNFWEQDAPRPPADWISMGEKRELTPPLVTPLSETMDYRAGVDGSNVMLNPPMRLWPQWDKDRWGMRPLGGDSDNKDVYWLKDGCTPSCAAMVLRWFAEDRAMVPFPVKPGGTDIPAD